MGCSPRSVDPLEEIGTDFADLKARAAISASGSLLITPQGFRQADHHVRGPLDRAMLPP